MLREINGLRFICLSGTWYLIGVSGLIRLVRYPLSLVERWVRENAWSQADTLYQSTINRRV